MTWFKRPDASNGLSLLLGVASLVMAAISGCSESNPGKRPTNETPQVVVNYWDRFNARALATPEEQRAWPVIRDALIEHSNAGAVPAWVISNPEPALTGLTLADLTDRRSKPAPIAGPYSRHPEAETVDAAILIHWLDDHSGFIAALHDAAQRPYLGYVVSDAVDPALASAGASTEDLRLNPQGHSENPPLVSAYLPHLRDMREAAAILNADAVLATIESDAIRATRNLIAAARMGEFAQEFPFLLCQGASMGIQRDTVDVAMWVLADHPDVARDMDWRAIAGAVDRALNSINLVAALDGEQWKYEDFAQRTFSDDGQGDGMMTLVGLEMWSDLLTDETDSGAQQAPLEGLLGPNPEIAKLATRLQDRAAYNAVLDFWRIDLSKPFWDRASPTRGDDVLFSHSRLPGIEDKGKPFAMCAMLNKPWAGKVASDQRELSCRVAALHIAIAVVRYDSENGVWPDTLGDADLDGGPFIDAYSGLPLLYRLADDCPLIYSAGADRDDDNGKPYEGGTPIPPFIAFEELSQLKDFDLRAIDGDWILYPPQP